MTTQTRAQRQRRYQCGYHDARNARTFTQIPMPLLQQRIGGQPTRDVEQIAKRHFDTDYAKGYIAGWQEAAS